MFPSSARFLARSSPVVTLPPPARPSAAVGRLSRSSSHQRRYSSSKPPVPPSDGSRGIDTSSQSPTKSVSPSNKEGAEKREGKPAKRRGGKDSSNVSTKSKNNEPFLNLPSVPSTQHLHPHGNAISQGSAKTVDSDHFSSPDDLPMDDLRISIQDFAKKLRPFNPPPPPVPMESFGEQDATLEAETTEAAESELQEDVKEQSYSTLLTITESTHGDGRKTYEAHSSPLVRIDNKDAPSSSVFEGEKVIQDQGGLFSISEPEMSRHRQQHRVPHSMGRKVYSAISVKRQHKA
ncbi:predicted protein [Histoplasma mississippiense (nom. inval.)]|uniref:predicted protein n=1 Tax=Ajellomyces capsulatus (strain NAm1 / WU24) TaxID=2059318 RepID=UPI000157C4B3|nr:predicted protein [Histoplasma mississippiense (nom. inval.)]EDN08494.1 predicted protein [Histoplasma mississippiense (nom. inval.)]